MGKYKNYKTVNLPWLTDIPKHWQTYRIKRILQARQEKNDPVITDFILSLTAKQGVVPIAQKTGSMGNKPKADLSLYSIARKNDLLVNCMNVILGSAGVSRWDGAISPVYYALFPQEGMDCNTWYYHYIFRSFIFHRSLIGLGKGILEHRMRISMEYLNNVHLPVPPRSEQDQIVRYLDWQVSKINKLIAAKKKEIQLLKEQKQAIICHAVTKGLNPNAKMKDSGIVWLGEIPKHWIVKRAKFIYKKESRPVRDTDGVVTCFRDGVVTLRAKRRTTGFTESIQECGYQGIRKGDLVIHVMDAFAGAIGVSDSDGKGTPVYNVCTAIDDVNNYYYAHILRVMARTGFIQSLYRGIRERSSDFRFDVFAKQYLPVPPRPEQEKIIQYLDEQSQNIDTQVLAMTSEIELLHELRTRLISDVVTGQIDVRGVEVPDFEMVEEEVDETDEADEEIDENMEDITNKEDD